MAGKVSGPFMVVFIDGSDRRFLGEFDELAQAEECVKEEVPDDASGVRITKVVKRYDRGWIANNA